MRSPHGETTRWVAGFQTSRAPILSDDSVCLSRSLQEVFPCNPSEEGQHDPHHLSCACAASPCSPVGPSSIILSSCIMLSSGLAAKMTRLFFAESRSHERCAAQSPRCSPTLFFLRFFGHRCISTRIFFFTSKMVHETGPREVAGRSDRHTRSGSDCLRGNLRLLRTHFCDGRICYRSFPTGRACRLSNTGTWTREGPRSMGRSCVGFYLQEQGLI